MKVISDLWFKNLQITPFSALLRKQITSVSYADIFSSTFSSGMPYVCNSGGYPDCSHENLLSIPHCTQTDN